MVRSVVSLLAGFLILIAAGGCGRTTAPQPTIQQELRLIAAVQLSYFTSKGAYALPEQLQQDAFLDPQWPRSRASYRVDCQLPPSGGFVCYADPLSSGKPYYRVDATQVVRQEMSGRPSTGSSPAAD